MAYNWMLRSARTPCVHPLCSPPDHGSVIWLLEKVGDFVKFLYQLSHAAKMTSHSQKATKLEVRPWMCRSTFSSNAGMNWIPKVSWRFDQKKKRVILRHIWKGELFPLGSSGTITVLMIISHLWSMQVTNTLLSLPGTTWSQNSDALVAPSLSVSYFRQNVVSWRHWNEWDTVEREHVLCFPSLRLSSSSQRIAMVIGSFQMVGPALSTKIGHDFGEFQHGVGGRWLTKNGFKQPHHSFYSFMTSATFSSLVHSTPFGGLRLDSPRT